MSSFYDLKDLPKLRAFFSLGWLAIFGNYIADIIYGDYALPLFSCWKKFHGLGSSKGIPRSAAAMEHSPAAARTAARPSAAARTSAAEEALLALQHASHPKWDHSPHSQGIRHRKDPGRFPEGKPFKLVSAARDHC